MADNYLLRMVERAAGRSAQPTPQPPQQFYWPLPWEEPARFSGTAPFPSARVKAPSQSATSLSLNDRETEAQTSVAPAIVQPVHDLAPPIPPAANEKPDFEIASRPPWPADENASAQLNPQLTRPALIQPSVPQPTNIFHENIHGEKHQPASLQDQGLMVENHATQDAFHLNGQEHSHGRRQPAAQQNAEPIVEVHIGRVEVRLDTPRQPEARAVPKASGFAEFESMRRYTAGPWLLRKR